jgi:hypothetical protein
MVATLTVERGTGVATSVVWGAGATVRLRTDDANTADLTNPIPIDTVLRLSFWASIRIDITGTFTEVSNIRHHCDAGGIGWTMGATGQLQRGNRDTGDMGVPNASYEQATGSVGTTGNNISASHTFYSGQTVKVADLSSDNGAGNAKLIDSTTYTGVSPTKHIVLQVLVDTDATSGLQTAETLTWLVDEI